MGDKILIGIAKGMLGSVENMLPPSHADKTLGNLIESFQSLNLAPSLASVIGQVLTLGRIDCPPLVLIGPGTGIAPLRALIWEWLRRAATTKFTTPPRGKGRGTITLYSGARQKDTDDHYNSEWDMLSSQTRCAGNNVDPLFTHRPAYSRSPPELSFRSVTKASAHIGRVYVQHLMEEDAERLWRLIGEEGGYVIICGWVTCWISCRLCSVLKVFQSTSSRGQRCTCRSSAGTRCG